MLLATAHQSHLLHPSGLFAPEILNCSLADGGEPLWDGANEFE